ncbi:ABC transporter ATP-binding protein [Aeromicrobium sp. YIM 150415]|uniref:ABC transporter ATP-binding protein n=1 Tax=Aeromicrobium sp. YIM 150415 TaxID=2803912 RepID=UPI0019645393|nr:ABC transporter ATP-binding protein [Aeromicrobium sp. YIM 150415]MBM9463790.1 ABC transporter ATP-binding protein [Aeromicrobium sp. YIM 150415]
MAEQLSVELRAEGLALGYGRTDIVSGVDLTLAPGTVTAVVGANGSGKSTLLRGLARLLPATSGRVLLGGQDIRRLSQRTLGKRIAVLPQAPVAPEGIRVADLVARGRYVHQSWLRPWSRADEDAVGHALDVTGCAAFATRPLDELSGGQRQRAWIAMVIAQDAGVLLLDEPITFLDLAHQLDVLDLLADLNQYDGRSVVMVLHDLNLAARYAHRIVVMRSGQVLRDGAPDDVVDDSLLAEAFGLDAKVVRDEVAGTPHVLPIGRHLRLSAPPAPASRKEIP